MNRILREISPLQWAVIAFLGLFVFTGCDATLPLREGSEARKAIIDADTLQAGRLAPETYNRARNELLRSHDYLAAGNGAEARRCAAESKRLAVQSGKEAEPLLLAESMKRTESLIEEAKLSAAPDLAPDSYRLAVLELSKAKNEQVNGNFRSAYAGFLAAERQAVKARDEARKMKPVILDEVSMAREYLDRAEKLDKTSTSAFQSIRDTLNSASEDVAADKLAKGLNQAKSARILALKAYTNACAASSSHWLILARKKLDSLESRALADRFIDEIRGARIALDQAKRMHENGNFIEAAQFSKESVRLAEVVNEESSSRSEDSILFFHDKKPGGKGDIFREDERYYYYRVKEKSRYHDSLWNIAQLFMGRGEMWIQIFQENRSAIGDPDIIHPGMIIKIPKNQVQQ